MVVLNNVSVTRQSVLLLKLYTYDSFENEGTIVIRRKRTMDRI